MTPSARIFLTAGALACALLAGCGGGGGGDDSAPQQLPTDAASPEASESVAGLLKYLNALIASPADDKEPVGLGSFMPKAADDAEPEPIG